MLSEGSSSVVLSPAELFLVARDEAEQRLPFRRAGMPWRLSGALFL
jgi:hypothetical protein